jgi:hypothetical protein
MVLSGDVLPSWPVQLHTGLPDQKAQVQVQFPVPVHVPALQLTVQRSSVNAYAR